MNMDRVNSGVLRIPSMPAPSWRAPNRMEILLFSLAPRDLRDQRFPKKVRRCRTPSSPRRPTCRSAWKACSLRGNVIPVLRWPKVMGIPEPQRPLGKSMMVTEYSKRALGFLVHEVDRIIRRVGQGRAPDNVTSGSHHFITAITGLGTASWSPSSTWKPSSPAPSAKAVVGQIHPRGLLAT